MSPESSPTSPVQPLGPSRRARSRSGRGDRRGSRVVLLGGALILGLVLLSAWFMRATEEDTYLTFAVRRGPLEIKVVEGGSIESLEPQEIKSEVKGWQGTKILSIVTEGYYVTEEDVENGLVLVQLDQSELSEKLTTAQITFKGTQVAVTTAEQGYEIQLNQSETDIYETELEVKFARMEMEKFLGRGVAEIVEGKVEETERLWTAAKADRLIKDSQTTHMTLPSLKALDAKLIETDAGDGPVAVIAAPVVATVSSESTATAAPEEVEPIEMTVTALRLSHPDIEFSDYADPKLLGSGEASQKIRKFEDDLLLAERDHGASEAELEGTRRLFKRDFVTQRDLENAEMDVQKKAISVKTAKIAMHLFLEYEFPKNSEKLMSDYIKALRKLERTERKALSELAKAQSQLLSSQARFRIEEERIRELEDQILKCTMRAEKVGLVVYGGSGPHYWNEEPIKEGATIRERQAIITIPDMSKMAVRIKIHESDIQHIEIGQLAHVRIDAFADRLLKGEVTKVGVLPDTENRWRNPDMKVYETTIAVEGTHTWLKPGMSAQVEVIIKTLKDVHYIPIQSVVPQGEDQVCFVIVDNEPQRRVIETGEITVEFITITKGLEEGEKILIRPPEGSRQDQPSGTEKKTSTIDESSQSDEEDADTDESSESKEDDAEAGTPEEEGAPESSEEEAIGDSDLEPEGNEEKKTEPTDSETAGATAAETS